MNFTMLGEWWPFTYFKETMAQVPALIMYWFFRLIQAICKFFVSLPENMFKLVTGTGAEWKWGAEGTTQTTMGGSTGNDIVMAFLRSTVVQTTFFTVLGFSIVLLVIFTVIALIRSEFTTDIAKAAKGPYINRALKGIMNFILVPVLSLVFVIGVNVLTRGVNSLFGGGNDTLANSIYKITLYGSERTSDKNFRENYLKTGAYNHNNTENADEAISRYNSKIYSFTNTVEPYNTYTYDFTNVTYSTQNDVANKNTESLGTLTIEYEDGTKIKNIELYSEREREWSSNPYASSDSFGLMMVYVTYACYNDENGKKQHAPYYDNLAALYLNDKEIAENKYNTVNIFENATDEEDFNRIINEMMFQSSNKGVTNWTLFCKTELSVNLSDSNKGYIPWHCALILAPTITQMQSVDTPLECGPLVNFFYNPAQFHLVMGMAAAIILGWNLMGVVILLIKRALELAILFMISPVAVALYPLDDGAATNKWRQAWQGRILAPTTIVFAYNIFFALVDLLSVENISLPFWFNNGLFKLFWTLVVVMCMSSLLKTASKLLCDIVGAEDMIGNSSAMMDKAVKTATSAAGAIATVAAPAAGAAMKAAKKGISAATQKSKVRDSQKAMLKEKGDEIDALKKEREGITDDPEKLAGIDKEIAAKEAERTSIQNWDIKAKAKERAKLAKENPMLDKLQKYDASITVDDIKNKTEKYKKAEEQYSKKQEGFFHNQKKREGVYKTAMGYATLLLPKDNEAVKLANQMTDHKERRKLYMTSYGVSQAEKKEAEAKMRSDNEKAFKQEQKLREEREAELAKAQSDKEKKAAAEEKKAIDMETIAFTIAKEKEKDDGGKELKVLQAKIEKAEMTGNDKELQEYFRSLGVDEKYKELESASKTLRDAARAQLDAANEAKHKWQADSAIGKNMEQMLPDLGKQLSSIKTSITSHLAPNIRHAISEAIKDSKSADKGFDKYNESTQALLKAITACQGGLSDLNTLIATLQSIKIDASKDK